MNLHCTAGSRYGPAFSTNLPDHRAWMYSLECIRFAYGSGFESIYKVVCRIIAAILANRSCVCHVGQAVSDDPLRSVERAAVSNSPDYWQWCGPNARTRPGWGILGTVIHQPTNPTARQLCRLVCWFQAGCCGACVSHSSFHRHCRLKWSAYEKAPD